MPRTQQQIRQRPKHKTRISETTQTRPGRGQLFARREARTKPRRRNVEYVPLVSSLEAADFGICFKHKPKGTPPDAFGRGCGPYFDTQQRKTCAKPSRKPTPDIQQGVSTAWVHLIKTKSSFWLKEQGDTRSQKDREHSSAKSL